jgi:ADP-ribosylglycohydrolase/protein-tyrosine phosphatase
MIRTMNAPPPDAIRAALPERPIPDSYWVLPARLLAGEHPGATSRASAMDRLRRFLAIGVSCFIDLTEPDETPAYEAFLPFATPEGRRVVYLREPIPDHDVPTLDVMTRILRLIDDALASDHIVYLHCRAGVGRSAMAVGCWLAEHGARGNAMNALQDLWRQSARSRTWSLVPETEEQVEFVRNWAAGVPARPPPAMTEPELPERVPPRPAMTEPDVRESTPSRPAMAEPELRERAAGALFGLAVGDAFGASLATGGAAGVWTQHTALALCVADSLVACGGLDPRDQMQRFLRWQSEGYLAATTGPQHASPDVTRALATYRWRGQPMAGSHDPRDRGTASLSRAVVAALIESDASAAVALAGECSRTTHQSPHVVDACRYLAAMLTGVLRGEARALAEPPYSPHAGFWSARPLKPEVAALEAGPIEAGAEGAAPRADAIRLLDRVRRIVVAGERFEAALRAAVTDAPDPAAYGAIAGALAGAAHGLRDLPTPLLGTLQRRDLLDEQLTRILGRRTRTPDDAPAGSSGA